MGGRLRSVWGALGRRRDFEEGMSEELRFHIAQYTAELVRAGVPEKEAERRAHIEFGSIEGVKGDCREARGLRVFDELARELRYAARLLRKSPGFTAAALLTLAVCLGANLTIFAAIDSILLRPLPFPEAERLVTVYNTYPKAGVERDGASTTNYYERRGRIAAFGSLSIYNEGTATVGEAGATERVAVSRVSPEFFATLGAGPARGRAFTEEETAYGRNGVVILSDGYWRQRLHGDAHALGRQIRVNGAPATVVGVLPPGFRFLSSEARLYFPFASRPEDRGPGQRHSGGNVTQMIARLRPGATVEQAQAQLDTQNAALERDDPQAKMMADAGFRTVVTPAHADHVAAVRPMLWLLQAGVLALLLIGAVNLANLLLMRASGRVKESAVRQALGAGRGHIVSEALVETTLLTLAGGLLGLAVAAGGIRLLAALGADRLPLGSGIAFDGRLALAGVAAAVAMGIALAAPVVWFQLRRQAGIGLQGESRGGTSGRSVQMVRHGFIVAQIALAFLLLAGSGLLGLSLKRAMEISPGFRPGRVLTGEVSLPGQNYPDEKARGLFVDRLMERLARTPGVMSAGVASNVPLSGRSGKSAATVKGRAARPGESPRGHYSYWVGGDYFETLGFGLRAGRFLTAEDSRRGRRVCVVDDDFARYYWPDGGAVGQKLFEGSAQLGDGEAFTVVGVMGSVKQAGLTDEAAQGAVYYPYFFRRDNGVFVAARTSLPPEALGLTLQKAVREIDADLPVNDVRSMETRMADSLLARRSPALLAGLFSAMALLLTSIGTYGVLSYAVAQRRREIGLRMALGARPEQQIRGQFVRLASGWLGLGLALGGVGVWLAGRAIETVLFHVAPMSLAVLGGTAGVMAAVSLAACVGPAWRAARISPREALGE